MKHGKNYSNTTCNICDATWENQPNCPKAFLSVGSFKARATHCDFLHNFLQTIPQQATKFFFRVHAAIFSARLCRWFEEGGEIKLIKIHFLSWIPFLHTECGHNSIWSCCFTSNIYASHCDFTCKIFLKKLKTFLQFCEFFKNMCQFLHKNLTIFAGKSKSSNVPIKIDRFF